MQGQRMLGSHGTKRHAHDGVRTGCEHIHAPVTDQCAIRTLNVVREGKPHAFRLANPVFLHQPHFVGPTVQSGFVIAHLNMVEQFWRVARDVQVVAGNFAFFNQRTRAPTASIDHLLVGQHGLVHRIPIDHLGFAVRDAFFEHLQKQPLVPLVVARVTRGHLTRPVNGQPDGLHLLLHVGDVFVSPLGRRHPVFERRVFCGQTKSVPAHGHQNVVAFHAQMAREHVVDGVVANVAHVQLAAGVRQHRAGIKLFLGRVFGDAIGIALAPSGLQGALDLGVVVFFLHGISRKAPTHRSER